MLRRLLFTRQLDRTEHEALEAEQHRERHRDTLRSLRDLIDARTELVERTKAAQLEELVDGLRDLED